MNRPPTRNNRRIRPSFAESPRGTASNMPRMPTLQILLYQEMNALSSRMAAAARAGDRESLNRLARSVAGLRQSLQENDDNLSATELQQKAALIQRILDDDAEIRRHTEPWMENLCRFLGETARPGRGRTHRT
jgi:flagellar protein FliT